MDAILAVGKQSLMITLFVLSMMLIIEYLNVLTRGIWSKDLKASVWKQIVLGALLGIIPGCLGAYTAVSMYVHNIIGIGALVSTMIATSGDEAFLMFSVIPETALILHVVIFVIAIISGFVVQYIFKDRFTLKLSTKHFHLHDTPECVCFDKRSIFYQLVHIRPKRLFLLLFILAMIVFLLLGFNHSEVSIDQILSLNRQSNHHNHPAWIRITFLVILLFSLFTILTVNDHFLEKHLWGHLLKKHFLKIFLWSFGTLLLFHYLDQHFDLNQLVNENLWLILIVAVLIGIVPESGPHFIFVILFAGGTLPFSILLANSIVQDGHGSLPLIAESPKGFVIVKAINIAVGLLVGAAGLLAGF
jgi:hypothetical protein